MKLIIGLGNPGKEYSGNRHNVGFQCLSRFAKDNHISLDKKCCLSRTGSGRINDEEIVLAKPQTYMNLSGKAASQLLRRYNLKAADIIVVQDDLDLPAGKIRLRLGGSAGGHNGISSIITDIGTKEFIRLKIGIGKPDSRNNGTEVVDHVLGNFGGEEREIMEKAITRASEALTCLLTCGLDTASNRFNS
ncbi:aminoacyl-tRNA hydrolase [Dehalococcoides mccartyi]|uniref:Peptidyl-tRNA hydrolase n=1 Tax=Dehalococcoides mccartyi (strain VS) TaxID=311424 RepID=D2BH87_DEHMV|nr:aminoacyl-tRNA hydrolase [Dehalococcoides mccartyi]ACZ61687.1 peptidyl-tRNA hydrolase [Dehalococcoides mccartyi VS]